MKYGPYIVTLVAITLVLISAHYGIQAFFRARLLQTEVEVLAVRTRTMRHQLGELEQKLRVMNRVKSFVDRARAAGLSADQWSEYAVNIEDQVSFRELGRIVEQCVHNNTDLFFKPISFHVAVGQPKEDGITQPVSRSALADNASRDDGPSDVVLGLKGTFMVRH